MTHNRIVKRYIRDLALGISLVGCMPVQGPKVIPSKVYADELKAAAHAGPQGEFSSPAMKSLLPLGRFVSVPQTMNENGEMRAQMRLVSDRLPPELSGPGDGIESDLPGKHVPREPQLTPPPREVITNQGSGYKMYRSPDAEMPSYRSGLSYGDPGVSSSLWKETRSGNDLFRDYRAWQPMDLITIVVKENAQGKKSADTETKEKSTIALAISKLFGLENAVKDANDGTTSKLDPTALVSASSQNDFKGEGKTNRSDSLTATISAMVAEVLPSGILRIEGQKIIAMNSEEQVMVISGLVRPQDVTSENSVDSSKVANMRIDYYGNGILGEAQYGGWLGRIFNVIWPF